MNEMELILTDIFNCTRADLYLNSPSTIINEKKINRLQEIFKERARNIPVQYILGYADFFGLKFKVNKNALIPRPETEILVETVINRSQETEDTCLPVRQGSQKITILDIGTGSGCIAITLSKFLENAEIIAIDISKKALDLAKENAKIHNVSENAKFLQSDLFTGSFFRDSPKFDIIVSNPPYVPTAGIGVFDKSTLNEPKIALDGGSDGLDFYRKIIKQASSYMKSHGFLIMEMGFCQYPKIKKIFEEDKKFEVVDVVKDYGNIDRIIVARGKWIN